MTEFICKKKLQELFDRFAPVGALPIGGVTRLAYTEEEDRMHEIFRRTAVEWGFRAWSDGIGNSYAANFPEGTKGYTIIGSHLDSVIEGGAYDGVAGVAAGMLILCELKARGINAPVLVAAFRCEESSNFKLCTVGSGVLTGAVERETVEAAANRYGQKLMDAIRSHGYDPDHPENTFGAPKKGDYARYFELHIEQAKVLYETHQAVGIVTAIAAPRRFILTLHGLAEHSGATPMEMRRDSLCTAAEIILAIERAGWSESVRDSVATVGGVSNSPNVMNVIPGITELQIDIRGTEESSITRVEHYVRESIRSICMRREVEYEMRTVDVKKPVLLDEALQDQLENAAKKEALSYRRMPSGAGHDAMCFADYCPTAMLFIPCKDGISHNIREFCTMDEIADGARVLLRLLMEENQ